MAAKGVSLKCALFLLFDSKSQKNSRSLELKRGWSVRPKKLRPNSSASEEKLKAVGKPNVLAAPSTQAIKRQCGREEREPISGGDSARRNARILMWQWRIPSVPLSQTSVGLRVGYSNHQYSPKKVERLDLYIFIFPSKWESTIVWKGPFPKAPVKYKRGLPETGSIFLVDRADSVLHVGMFGVLSTASETCLARSTENDKSPSYRLRDSHTCAP